MPVDVEKIEQELRASIDQSPRRITLFNDEARALLYELSRLREALKPFAGEKLPSSRKIRVAYNRHGLRCAMSDLEIAQDAAARALSEREGQE